MIFFISLLIVLGILGVYMIFTDQDDIFFDDRDDE